MAPTTDQKPGVQPAPSRRSSTRTAVLALAAVALVTAGAAWAGHGGKSVARPRPSVAPGTPTTAAPASSPGGLPAEAQALLDEGNAAFRAGQFEAALAHYRAVAERLPTHAAPWYSIHMVAQKLGRTALADSATAALRERTDVPTVWEDSATRRAHEAAGAQGNGRAPAAHP
ncbi:MAG: hypothetical protein ACXW0Z_19365 [Gemmatirosa sp.]